MSYRHEISNADWERVKDILPPENTGEGRPSKSNRDMLNGMLGLLRRALHGGICPNVSAHGKPYTPVFGFGV